jgi:hypothetical protein
MQLQTDNRSWADLDNNGSAVDASGNPQFAEIGPSRNSNFGVPKGATRFDPETPRPTNWEENFAIVHQLMNNLSMTAAYYHRTFYDQSLTRNLLVNPATDYTTYTITAPADARLPNGGGEVITMYNLKPEKLGLVDSVSSFSTDNTRVYDGFEVSANARIKGGGFLIGSITTDRVAVNTCDVANSDPNNLRFCQQTPPFRGLYKLSASYRCHGNSRPAAPSSFGRATRSVRTTRSTAPVAGVALTGGGNRTVVLVDPTTKCYDYIRQWTCAWRALQNRRHEEAADLRGDLQPAERVNRADGQRNLWTALAQPQIIDQPRHFQFGAQLDF